jgi:hypothetical protein
MVSFLHKFHNQLTIEAEHILQHWDTLWPLLWPGEYDVSVRRKCFCASGYEHLPQGLPHVSSQCPGHPQLRHLPSTCRRYIPFSNALETWQDLSLYVRVFWIRYAFPGLFSRYRLNCDKGNVFFKSWNCSEMVVLIILLIFDMSMLWSSFLTPRDRCLGVHHSANSPQCN